VQFARFIEAASITPFVLELFNNLE
jgi:hypothetical protein